MGRLTALSTLVLGLTLAGCQSSDDYRQVRIEKAQRHFDTISKRSLDGVKSLTLPMCISDALKNNLDLKVEELQEAVYNESKTAAMLGMLPQLNAEWNIQTRNNLPGATSIDLKTNQTSLQYSRSSEKTEHNYKFELALSVLDFGMAYFNSVQAQDQIILSQTQKRRVAQNMIYDVAKAYFEVASTQDAIVATNQLIARCHGIDKIFDALRDSRSLSNLRILDERKRFINLEKRLMYYQRHYANSCVRLRTLMGYLPMEDIKVDTSFLQRTDLSKIPPVEKLEEVALRARPELSQMDIQAHINVVEARKAILMMLPNVKLFTDWQYSSNPFLYHQGWWEIGMRASYDLLKLPSKVMRYQAIQAKGSELEMRTKALSIAVMAQVRMAHANFMDAEKVFAYRDKAYQVYREQLEMARKTFKSGSAVSRFDIDRMELETADRYIRRVQALGDCYMSYYRLVNTVGLGSLSNQEIEKAMKAGKTPAQTAAL